MRRGSWVLVVYHRNIGLRTADEYLQRPNVPAPRTTNMAQYCSCEAQSCPSPIEIARQLRAIDKTRDVNIIGVVRNLPKYWNDSQLYYQLFYSCQRCDA